ncbi:transcription factor mef2A isoform X2 [Arabidopsis lyrata subsp. lyrata]|uniref:transcription factor mef2A isoform X2 n=1 Tax=Arabidopsis lyrata subsp. lyrata TaxID=81972 RepID=UPI000A29BFCA|nr:transcription factor mef2A isoform X2 [Arabidopsis lyrata subsp. lyrata]|eukprot:XP_002871556.2 transcription factor mef2A isoform X2 [Arabidopsis lyrata subsp. lyrata]
MVSAAESSSSSSTLLLPCAFANSFAFMRLLQKAHHFAAVSEDDDNNKAIRLGSDHQAKDNNHHQVCRRDCSFMADQEEPRSTTSRLSSKDDDHDNNSNNNNNNNNNNEAEDHEMRQQGWLRLSIGHEEDVKPDLDHRQQHQTDPTARRDSFLELNLFSGGLNKEEEVGLPLSSLFHHQHQPGGMMINPLMFHNRPQDMIGPWAAAAFRTPFVPQNLTQPSSSSASLMMPLMGPYFGRSSFQPQLLGNDNPDVVAGPSSSFRVIDPPRRPHSGIWFLLQASQNQTVEPFLPQIPKSYLRIKDGKMTVRLLMKYLVNKLRLEHESQVEIRCRGQELEPVLTLQHVRDSIWRGSRDNPSLSQNITLLPNSSTSDHLMVLHYGRTIS